jgi:hypothetical protein
VARPGELERVARNLEVDVGCGDDASALLETDLVQAEVLYGKNSPEYLLPALAVPHSTSLVTLPVTHKFLGRSQLGRKDFSALPNVYHWNYKNQNTAGLFASDACAREKTRSARSPRVPAMVQEGG